MSGDIHLLSRRSFIRTVPMGVAGTVILTPEDAVARWGVGVMIFRIGGYGLGAILGGGIALGLLAAGAAAAVGYGVHAAFRGGSRSYGYGGGSYAAYTPSGWTRRAPPKPIIIKVDLDPKKQIDGDVLRVRAIEQNILKNDGVVLPRGGRLMIEEDGKMEFADTKFRGYATMQNNSDLSVFTPDDQLVVTRAPRLTTFHNIHHDSHDGRLALTSLLGDIKHA